MRTIYQFHFLTSIILFTSGCKKAVEVAPPITQFASSSVFQNDITATQAQLNLYTSMVNDPFNYHIFAAMSSDEYTSFSTSTTYVDVYKNSLSATSDGAAIGFWSNSFTYLYRINAILEGIKSSSGMSLRVKQQLLGEALFTRAYLYFYLTNFYRDVPIVTTTDYTINSTIATSPQARVYQQILQDLHIAEGILSGMYLDATDTTVTSDHVRPTNLAAAALLARVYLYTENWNGADSAATAVINSSTYSLSPLSGPKSVFMANSAEAIWQILPAPGSNYTPEGNWTILSAPPSAGTNNCFAISPALINAFEPADQRYANWVDSFSQGTNKWYFPYKYKNGNKATSLTEYTMILRLGEQYLIRAEAKAHEGDISGALADLNSIRKRAGLANYTGSMDNASLLNAILHERQIELFGEGHRWFDLRRTGNIDAIMGSPGNGCVAKGGLSWNSYQQLYPVPLSTVQLDPYLAQTPGY